MNYKQNILGIIPARAGSKRVPGKNKKKLAGKELIRYAIEACIDSTLLNKIIVTSDDKDILKIADNYHQINRIERPNNISGDKAAAITYVDHTLSILEDKFTHIVIIQPTSPFTTGADIDHTIDLLVQNEDADSAVSVMKLDHAIHPIKLKLKNLDQELVPYLQEEKGKMAEHELPEIFVRNCSVYASKIHVINKGKIIGDKCLGYVMPRERSIDINDPIDFAFAEFLIERR